MAKRTRQAASLSDRDAQWISEANTFARVMVPQYFEVFKTGQHTPADVLQWIDDRENLPGGWLRWMSDRHVRYQMVANAVKAMAKEGLLDTSETINAQGQHATSFIPRRIAEDWSVEVDGTGNESVTSLVRRWLHTHDEQLQGVVSITLTRKGTIKADVNRSGEDGGRRESRDGKRRQRPEKAA